MTKTIMIIDTDTYKHSAPFCVNEEKYDKIKDFCEDNHYIVQLWTDLEMDEGELSAILRQAERFYNDNQYYAGLRGEEK